MTVWVISDDLSIFSVSKCVFADSREKSSKKQNIPGGNKGKGVYPFMSNYQKNRFTVIDSYGKTARWKHEWLVVTICLTVCIMYWGFLRKEHHVDGELISTRYMEEMRLRDLIKLMAEEGLDTKELEEKLEKVKNEPGL